MVQWTAEALAELGKVPDTVIAARLGVSHATVSNHRNALGIPAMPLPGRPPATEINPGDEFGRLRVRCAAKPNKRGWAVWLCDCKCGNETLVTANNLCKGHTQSCGCWNPRDMGPVDTERLVRILRARLRGEKRDVIAAREGVSGSRISHLIRQAKRAYLSPDGMATEEALLAAVAKKE